MTIKSRHCSAPPSSPLPVLTAPKLSRLTSTLRPRSVRRFHGQLAVPGWLLVEGRRFGCRKVAFTPTWTVEDPTRGQKYDCCTRNEQMLHILMLNLHFGLCNYKIYLPCSHTRHRDRRTAQRDSWGALGTQEEALERHSFEVLNTCHQDTLAHQFDIRGGRGPPSCSDRTACARTALTSS